MRIFFTFAVILLIILLSSTPLTTHAERGSGSTGTSKSDDTIKSTDDDGTPDQGRGDFDAFGNSIDDSSDSLSDDDGTPDQGRGDSDEDDDSNNDSDRSIMRSFRVWILSWFGW